MSQNMQKLANDKNSNNEALSCCKKPSVPKDTEGFVLIKL